MQLVFATNNRNKLKEVQALVLEPIQLLSLEDIDCLEDIPETQPTIEGNAIQKIEYLKKHYNIDGFADDTGLEVKALHGEPGVFSARYAGNQRNAQDNMDKLLKNLEGKTNRSAQFKTVIALTLKGQLHTFTGICRGTILTEKRGDQGFGYDPIFIPTYFTQTFGEMQAEEKKRLSHRTRAFNALVERYFKDTV